MEVKSKRVFGLDVIRATAAFLVVLWHAYTLQQIIIVGSIGWIAIRYCGFIGVELFFALSGFLIGRILIRTFESFQGFPSIRNFWKHRWFRTLPNYYLFLLINILLTLKFLSHMKIIVMYSLFIQNLWWPMISGFFGASWSLSVEEWFYILLPIISIIVFYSTKRSKHTVLYSACILGTASIIFRIYMAYHLPKLGWEEFRKIVFARFDAIALGIIAGYMSYFKKEIWERYYFSASLIGCIALTFSFMMISIPTFIISPFGKVFLLFLAPFGCACLLPVMYAWKNNDMLWGKIVTKMSESSYSLYLCQVTVATCLFIGLHHYRVWYTTHKIIFAGLFFIISYSLSFLMYYIFEKPIMNMQKREKV